MTINIKKRRRERERALRAVFQLDYHKDEKDLKRAVAAVVSGEAGFDEDGSKGKNPSNDSDTKDDQANEDTRYAELLCETVLEHRSAIDERISRYLRKDWPFERIPEAEKAVLRVAAAEMIYLRMPREIAINEAVELAKQYGSDNAQNYINGILHRMSVDNKKTKADKTDTDKAAQTKEDKSQSDLEQKKKLSVKPELTDESASDGTGKWTLSNSETGESPLEP